VNWKAGPADEPALNGPLAAANGDVNWKAGGGDAISLTLGRKKKKRRSGHDQ
jgi:hypothetical protein